MSSILTNNSAMVALQTLKGINSNLAKTQDEISTGKKVANAQDNAAVWAISKVMEYDQSSFKTLQSNLNMAESVVTTARKGGENVQSLLNEMKNLAAQAGSDGNDYATINAQIVAKKAQITSIVNASQMNGANLLKTNPVPGQTDFSVLASMDRTAGNAVTSKVSITVASVDFEANESSSMWSAILRFRSRSCWAMRSDACRSSSARCDFDSACESFVCAASTARNQSRTSSSPIRIRSNSASICASSVASVTRSRG